MKLTVDKEVQAIPFYPKAMKYGADSGWIRLSSNENPYPPSAKVVTRILESIFDVNRYPESEFELKVLLSQKYAIKAENVCIGNGSNEIIETSLKAMRTSGKDRVLIPEPSFAFYSIAAKIYGYEPVPLALPDLRIDLNLIRTKVDSRTRVIFLNNPNNPTGLIFEEADFLAFLKDLPPEILVVVDEAYAEYAQSSKFPRSTSFIIDHPILVLRTFSKVYGLAGLRIGYGIAEEGLISFLERTKQPFSVNMIALIAAKAALDDMQYVEKVLENNRKGKEYLCAEFTKLGLSFFPTEANYIMVRIGGQAESVTKKLFEKKILIRWLGGYGLTDYIRVSIGRMDENAAFVDALKRLLG